MTTLIGVQGASWSVIGFDSRVSDDELGSRVYTLTKDSPKISSSGPYLLGAAGDMRAINILSYIFKPPNPGALVGHKLDRFMATQFIGELKSCFEENSYSKDGEHGSLLLVSVHGRIYEIGEDYAWCHDESGIYAVGSGGPYALGAIYSLLDGKKFNQEEAKAAVKQALTIAARLDSASGGPMTILVQSATALK